MAHDASRRDFLKSAALGLAGMALAPGVLDYMSRSSLAFAGPVNGFNDIRAFEGVLGSSGPGYIDLTVAGASHRLPVTSGTTYWRGGTTSEGALQVGDSVLVRLAPDYSVEYAWANLDRVIGVSAGRTSSGFVVHHSPGDPGTEVSFDPNATYERWGSRTTAADASARAGEPGTVIDAIGLRRSDGSLIATTVAVYDPGGAPAFTSTANAAGAAAAADPQYKGRVTWFYCPTATSHGACGTCNASKSNQAAWPNLGGGCQYSAGCLNQGQLSCGSSFTLYDCSQNAHTMVVVDCGPCQNCAAYRYICTSACSTCSQNPAGTICDLTKPTFAVYRNPASYGCFTGTAKY